MARQYTHDRRESFNVAGTHGMSDMFADARFRPDRWNLIGDSVYVPGASIILFAPRTA